MSSLFNTIVSALKKDDDTRMIESEGQIYLETSAPVMKGYEQVNMDENATVGGRIKNAMESIVEEAIVEPLPDIRVQSVLYMFMGNTCVMLLWFLGSAAIYYWTMPYMVHQIVMCIAAPLFAVSYGVMLWARKQHTTLAYVAFSFWAFSGALLFGSSASLAHNVAPIQLVVLFLIQSFVMLAYAKLSPRFISTVYAMIFMFVATLVVWAAFIFAFVEQNDWIGGIVILLISFLAILHCGMEIRFTEGRYNVSWADIRLSIIQFYGDPILELFKLCQK